MDNGPFPGHAATLGPLIRGGFEGVDLGRSASPSRGCVLSVFLAAAATTFAASTSWATAAASASGTAAMSVLPAAPAQAAFRGRPGLGRARASARSVGGSGSSFPVSVVFVVCLPAASGGFTVFTVFISRSKRTSCRDGRACLAVSLGFRAKTSPQGRRAKTSPSSAWISTVWGDQAPWVSSEMGPPHLACAKFRPRSCSAGDDPGEDSRCCAAGGLGQ